MAGGVGGGILIHQDVSVCLYSTFDSVLHILHRLLIQLGGGGKPWLMTRCVTLGKMGFKCVISL